MTTFERHRSDGTLPNLREEQASRPVTAGGSTARTAARRIFVDRAARWVVTGGGMAIIASILGILVFILLEVLPLTRSARIEVGRDDPGRSGRRGAHRRRIPDPRRAPRTGRRDPGRPPRRRRRSSPRRQLVERAVSSSRRAVPPGGTAVTASTDDGRVIAQTIDWRNRVRERRQRAASTPNFPAPVTLEVDLEHRPLGTFAAQLDGPERAAAAAQLADGTRRGGQA